MRIRKKNVREVEVVFGATLASSDITIGNGLLHMTESGAKALADAVDGALAKLEARPLERVSLEYDMGKRNLVAKAVSSGEVTDSA
jgi:hypothetical protein